MASVGGRDLIDCTMATMLLSRLNRVRAHQPATRLAAARLLSTTKENLIPCPRGVLSEESLAPLRHESLFDFLKREGKWDECPDKVALRCSLNSFTPITYKELSGRVSTSASIFGPAVAMAAEQGKGLPLTGGFKTLLNSGVLGA